MVRRRRTIMSKPFEFYVQLRSKYNNKCEDWYTYSKCRWAWRSGSLMGWCMSCVMPLVEWTRLIVVVIIWCKIDSFWSSIFQPYHSILGETVNPELQMNIFREWFSSNSKGAAADPSIGSSNFIRDMWWQKMGMIRLNGTSIESLDKTSPSLHFVFLHRIHTYRRRKTQTHVSSPNEPNAHFWRSISRIFIDVHSQLNFSKTNEALVFGKYI